MGAIIQRNHSMKKRKYKNIKSIFVLLFLSSIPYTVWLLFFLFPQYIKVISSGCLWLAIIFSLKNIYIHINQSRRFIDYMVLCLLLITFLQFIRFYIWGGVVNWLTVLTNPIHVLCLMPPILYYNCQSLQSYKYIYKYSIILIGISILCLHSNYYLLYLSPIFFYYSLYNKKYRKIIYSIIILSFLLILKDSFIPNQKTGDTQRALIIISGYAILVFIATKTRKYYKKIAIYTVCISIILPLTLLAYSITTKISVFTYANEIKNENLGGDTRSFLYTELLNDITKKDKFIEGFGISNGYYSPYFDNKNRDVNEVSFLHYLLRGGALWIFIYWTVIIYAIIYTIHYSKNYLCLGGSIILAGYFLASFIIDINGFNFIHVIIWFFITICSSPQWTQQSNADIYKLIK